MSKWRPSVLGAGAGMRVERLEKTPKTLKGEANYIDLASYAAEAFCDAIFASVDKLAQLPSIGRNEAGIHLPDTQETSLINCAIRLADSDRQCPYKPLHFPAAFLLHR
jgi:plasmid stabilization system protein ParE